ncbi:acidic leucine-rich nuclear phosphoprotein 32 family member B-like [Salvia splendens]|uniref:acidic leucine-rich nuclear phosphoprotein 32 family member B-like n=1 Tax=Salvia splendens TaxID=180675 RepID=UPI001C25CA38|nr:acidic leucine-rich nuclear phosphoprotein 32 family member B-like [Salvia splendens]
MVTPIVPPANTGDKGVEIWEGDREGIDGDEGSGDRTDEGSGDRTSEGVESGEHSKDVEEEILDDEDVEGEIQEESKADEREDEIVQGDNDEEDGTEKVDMDVDRLELSDTPELIEATKFIVVPDEGLELGGHTDHCKDKSTE